MSGADSDGPTVLIMAAGEGTRMRSSLPKVLHPVCGRPMVAWPVLAAREAGAGRVAVIVSPDRDLTPGLPEGTETVVQPQADGTGGAVRAAHDIVRDSETVVVLSGDHPLITGEIVAALLETHRAAERRGHRDDGRARRPGRLRPHRPRRGGDIERIVETKNPERRRPRLLAIREINTGTYAFAAEPLIGGARPPHARQLGRRVLPRRRAADAARATGCASSPTSPRTRTSTSASTTAPTSRWSAAEARRQILERHMLAGVTIVDPGSTWIDAEVEIAADATIEPGTTCAARPGSAPTRSSARTRP